MKKKETKKQQECMCGKVHKMKGEPRPVKQKIAIALSECGLSKKKKNKAK